MYVGKYYKISVIDFNRLGSFKTWTFFANLNCNRDSALKREYGDVVKLPAMFGRKALLMIYNQKDVETLLRHEGQHPIRSSFETLTHYRHHLRPDIYGEFGSAVTEYEDGKSIIRPLDSNREGKMWKIESDNSKGNKVFASCSLW